jgi:ferredoxin
MLCPEKALVICDTETGKAMMFNPVKCTGCGLCSNNCPQTSLKLLPQFDGHTHFPLSGQTPTAPPANDNTFTLQRG